MISGKTILIAALDWGLGHATRCVPIIKNLQKNNTVIIGITSLTKSIFEEEFPDLQKVNLPEYDIQYSSFLPVWMKLLLDWPRINKIIKAENVALTKMIDQYKIDCVISDNRFGLFSKKIHSVFITHQLFLKAPVFNSIAQYFNKKFILNFDEVWIPDYEDETKSLSGELSHGKHFHNHVKYIGPQSRLEKKVSTEVKYDYLILLSGPQPQHGLMAEQFVHVSNKYPQLKFAITSSLIQIKASKNLAVFFQPNALKLSEMIAQSKSVICRSGYSTLMDMHQLGKKSLFLMPTKGQTEQEYLAQLWSNNFKVEVISSQNLSEEFLS